MKVYVNGGLKFTVVTILANEIGIIQVEVRHGSISVTTEVSKKLKFLVPSVILELIIIV